MLSKRITIKMAIAAVFLSLNVCASAEVISFENLNVVPMDVEQVLNNYRVVVDGDKIIAVEPSNVKLKIKVDRKIDGQGKYLMPGLSDTHFHQYSTDFKEFDRLFKLAIANGITSVVSMGEWDGQDTIAIREYANNKKDVWAPLYFTAGPMLEPDTIKTAADAIETVRYHKKRGYDFIKVHGNLPQEAWIALLDEAQKNDIRVVGHAQRKLPIEFSLRLAHVAHMEEFVMQMSDEEHFQVADISDEQAKKLAKQVKDSGVFVSPTLTIVGLIQDYTDDEKFEKLKNRPETAYLAKNVYDEATAPNTGYRSELFLSPSLKAVVDKLIQNTRRLTKIFYQAGIPMLVGSDPFGMQVVGFSFHDEMERMHEVGMSNFDVLNSATVLSSRYLKRYPVAGTISVGKQADFILLADNPLNDLKNTRNVQGVMLKGKWLDKKMLDQFLADVEKDRKAEKQEKTQEKQQEKQ